MKFKNKAKPIKFSLLVGGTECRSVEDVKRNFDIDSLYESFKNQNLQKWLKQNGATEELQKMEKISGKDEKIQLYNLFSKNPLQKNLDEKNVVSYLEKGSIKFDIIKNTPLVDNVRVKKYAIDHNCVDNEIINHWCESDYDLLVYFYSQKSYANLNSTNRGRLIDLLEKGRIKFDVIKNTQLVDNIRVKKYAIDHNSVDKETINRWCEKDYDFLEYVYSKKSFGILNATNRERLIDLLEKGRIKYDVIKNTPLIDNVLVKVYAIDHNCVDNGTINRWCENDYDVLEYVYSKQSYGILNATNRGRLVDLLERGRIKFDVIKNTPLVDNVLVKVYAIDHNCVDNETINRWCEKNNDFLEYVYSKKSHVNLNATNCRKLIDLGFEKNVGKIMIIATEKSLNDILERLGKRSVKIGNVAIEMILVKGYSGGNFFIGKFPVTQAQWRAEMGINPSKFKGDDNPVESVSWDDCQDFIKGLNQKTGRKFRLPKEKEWEYAARGGNMSRKYTFSGGNSLDSVGWYKNNSRQKTHPVGQLKPNELGIYDMSGNVWEWCEDLYQPSEPNRVFRGGSWLNEEYSCNVCIEYSRSCNTPDHKSHNLGFRLVMDP